jgi:hypothetical protein
MSTKGNNPSHSERIVMAIKRAGKKKTFKDISLDVLVGGKT